MMDLKETVAAAKAEGLSYGEYVTKHSPPVTVAIPQDGSEPQVTQSEEPEKSRDIEKICPVCGKSFLVGPTQHRKMYCSDVCRNNAAKTGKPKPRAKTEPDTLCPANDQTAKADAGKAQLSLVPTRIIYAIARIREYGNRKYGDPENWRTVEPQRYRDAAFRHLLDYISDPKGVDSESGLPHLWRLACNIAFLCEMEARDETEQ